MADDRQLLAATWKVCQDSQISCQQYSKLISRQQGSKPVELTWKTKISFGLYSCSTGKWVGLSS
jgi:hypothetical protein